MSTNSPVTHLTRDVEAIQIPSGLTKKLTKGMPVIITQALGGTYTIVVEHSAGLFRVLAADADALGKVHVDDSALTTTHVPKLDSTARIHAGRYDIATLQTKSSWMTVASISAIKKECTRRS